MVTTAYLIEFEPLVIAMLTESSEFWSESSSMDVVSVEEDSLDAYTTLLFDTVWEVTVVGEEANGPIIEQLVIQH